eukprot:1157565-Pelagomonas_calceolata.AAC.10
MHMMGREKNWALHVMLPIEAPEPGANERALNPRATYTGTADVGAVACNTALAVTAVQAPGGIPGAPLRVLHCNQICLLTSR